MLLLVNCLQGLQNSGLASTNIWFFEFRKNSKSFVSYISEISVNVLFYYLERPCIYLLKDVVLLEPVQRSATKWTLNVYDSNYKSRLIALYLLPLMTVYKVNDLSFCFKSLQTLSSSFDISE